MPLNQYGDHATFIARDYHDVAGDLTIVHAYPGSLAEDAKQVWNTSLRAACNHLYDTVT